ncbi:MAG: rhodanese-like domain-containing protein [Clostridia bacterium]
MEHLDPKQTERFLRENPDALFIDCRSEMEYLFVGHPVGALHVAWNDGPDWEVNPHFVGQVKKLAGQDHAKRPIVLICRSGNRSQEAGQALEQQGFSRVYNVKSGFEGPLDAHHRRNTIAGWRFDGLPWEQC